MPRSNYLTALSIGVLLVAYARGQAAPGAPPITPLQPAPPRPAVCVQVRSGLPLQAQLDATPAGGAVCLTPGTYAGPLTIHRPVTLWGPRDAVIRSNGIGTTIDVASDDVHLLGFSLEGSGTDAAHNDAALHLQGRRIEARSIRIRHSLFGIVVDRSEGVTLASNDIGGTPGTEFGLRGDAIRVWESHHLLIQRNYVHDMRDVLVWYSGQASVQDNLVIRGRYGTHFMHGDDSEAANNLYLHNIVGLFSMYSHRLRIHGNLFAGSDDLNGMGLGVKESDDLAIHANRFLSDSIGLYLDTSPDQADGWLAADGNLFGLCTTAIRFLGSPVRSRFVDNDFRSNQVHVQVQGEGNALSATWQRNYFDDYHGYDLNHDGVGDVPYRLESYAQEWTATHPEIAFFQQTPAFALIDTLGHLFPLFAPAAVLVDASPRMAPAPAPEVGYAH